MHYFIITQVTLILLRLKVFCIQLEAMFVLKLSRPVLTSTEHLTSRQCTNLSSRVVPVWPSREPPPVVVGVGAGSVAADALPAGHGGREGVIDSRGVNITQRNKGNREEYISNYDATMQLSPTHP